MGRCWLNLLGKNLWRRPKVDPGHSNVEVGREILEITGTQFSIQEKFIGGLLDENTEVIN
jgi:hypothetical protein